LEGEAKKTKGQKRTPAEIDSLVEEEGWMDGWMDGWKWMMMMMMMRVEMNSCSFGVLPFYFLK
jgi:hypothetical protein